MERSASSERDVSQIISQLGVPARRHESGGIVAVGRWGRVQARHKAVTDLRILEGRELMVSLDRGVLVGGPIGQLRPLHLELWSAPDRSARSLLGPISADWIDSASSAWVFQSDDLEPGVYELGVAPDGTDCLLRVEVVSDLEASIQLGLARLADSVGDLLNERDELERRLAEALGNWEEAQRYVDALEAQIVAMKVAAAASKDGPGAQAGRRLGSSSTMAVIGVLGLICGFAWSDEQADATITAAEMQVESAERIAGIDDLENEFDRKIAQCYDLALRVHSDLEGPEREQ